MIKSLPILCTFLFTALSLNLELQCLPDLVTPVEYLRFQKTIYNSVVEESHDPSLLSKINNTERSPDLTEVGVDELVAG